MFVSFVPVYLSQALIITLVARFLDRLRFISFKGFVLVLFLLVLVDSQYYGTSGMQRVSNFWHVRNLLVMVLRLNKLAESIVILHARLLRPSTNFHHFLWCILHSSRVDDNAREDPFLLPRIFIPKEVHL